MRHSYIVIVAVCAVVLAALLLPSSGGKPNTHQNREDIGSSEKRYGLLRHIDATAKPKVTERLKLSPFAYSPTTHYLVSLGGSIAAGAGLYPKLAGRYPRFCGQTEASYAYIMAQQLGMKLVQAACSDATTNHGVLGPQDVDFGGKQLQLPPQLNMTQATVRGALVTLLVGANNIHFIHAERFCLAKRCPRTVHRTYRSGLTSITAGVRTAAEDLLTEGAGKIIVDNYYGIFRYDRGDYKCIYNKVSSTDYAQYYSRLDNLNSAIARAISGLPNVLLVHLNFQNHGLCSSAPWVQALSARDPLHPNRLGQQAIARQNLTALGRV